MKNKPAGWTIRDEFAAHSPLTLKNSASNDKEMTYGEAIETLAAMNYFYADEMMKARKED